MRSSKGVFTLGNIATTKLPQQCSVAIKLLKTPCCRVSKHVGLVVLLLSNISKERKFKDKPDASTSLPSVRYDQSRCDVAVELQMAPTITAAQCTRISLLFKLHNRTE